MHRCTIIIMIVVGGTAAAGVASACNQNADVFDLRMNRQNVLALSKNCVRLLRTIRTDGE